MTRQQSDTEIESRAWSMTMMHIHIEDLVDLVEDPWEVAYSFEHTPPTSLYPFLLVPDQTSLV